MPKVCREISETYLTVSRPVVLDIVRQVCIQLDIPKHYKVELAGDNIGPLMKGSTIGDVNKDVDASFGNSEKVMINFKERPRDNSWSRISDYTQYQEPVFLDPKLKVSMTPVYDERTVEVGFTFRFKDRKTAQQVLNRIRNRISQLKKNYVHNAHYHYPIPDDILATLYAIYQAREKNHGYGETLGTWSSNCFTKAVTKLTNLKGKGTVIAIEEMQTGIVGGMDEELVPARDKGDTNLKYFFTGTYTFNYNSPISIILEYPMFIHNAALPPAYRGIRNDQLREEINVKPYDSANKYLINLCDTHEPKYITDATNIPSWDEWNIYPIGFSSSELRLLNIAINLPTVDPDFSRDILDLKTLKYTFSEAAVEYLSTHTDTITQRGATPILIELYEWDEAIFYEDYYVTEDLIVRSKNPLDPRKNYHVAITVVTDMRVLSKQAQESIANSSDFANELIQFTKPGVTIPTIVPGVIHPVEWENAISSPNINHDDNYRTWHIQNTILTVNRGLIK